VATSLTWPHYALDVVNNIKCGKPACPVRCGGGRRRSDGGASEAPSHERDGNRWAPPPRPASTSAWPKGREEPPAKAYDLFLSHASEDKDAIARPLHEALRAAGVSVWFDEAVLKLGDSLRKKIDEGLARCRYGVVILSPIFFSKAWPQLELDGLVVRDARSTALPVDPEESSDPFSRSRALRIR
jgi:hypothetical protein